MLSEEILSLAEYIKPRDLSPPVVKTGYPPEDILLSDPGKTAARLRRYILSQNVNTDTMIRFCGIFRFDGTVMADVFHRTGHPRFEEVCGQYYGKPQENLATFEWQHSTADFRKLIDCGISQYISEIDRSLAGCADPDKADFLCAMRDTCETIIAWAHKCADVCERLAGTADGTRKKRLTEAAETLRRVPEFPARNFREGVQAVYLCFTFLPDSIGLIDRYLLRLYRKDISSGVLTRDEAADMIAELFIRICAHTPLQSKWAGDKGGESHFAIGGTLSDGSDGFNELSELIIDTMMALPLPRPQVSLRITGTTPLSVVRRVLECAVNDRYMRFALVGDAPRLRGLTEVARIPWDDAVNYTMVGCNEPALRGEMWFDGCKMNIARSLTNLLYKRTDDICSCRDFDSFFSLWEDELEHDLNRVMYWINGFGRARAKDKNVLSSIFINGCIESGKSVTECGGRPSVAGIDMIGLICVIDSLSIVKQLVFEEKKTTLRGFIDIMKNNWEGGDGGELRQYILKKGRFFGNNDDLSDEVARRVTDAIFRHTKDRTDLFGNHFLIGAISGYNPHHAWFGEKTDATPDGRRRGDAFMIGIGQSDGKDRRGLTALLCSVSQMDPHAVITGAYVCNVYLEESLVRDKDKFDLTLRILYRYFMDGGVHVQLNYVSKDELLKAKAHPEDYPSLRVRVTGFSGHFTNLQEEMQDEIIKRTVIGGR